MPHSIFMGRAMPGPGEPLFLPDDTDLALALAEEKRDACPQCGMPKVWCRETNKQGLGRARWGLQEDVCWATFRLAQRKPKLDGNKNPTLMERATMVSPTIREGYEPDIYAGLDVEFEEVGPD